MAKPHVTVRMYQGLLGDCFLIRLFDPAGTPDRGKPAAANILIDCGILQNVPDEEALIGRVTANIRDITGGRIDLLVITHEHYDHLSGIGHGRDLFLDGGIAIDHLWLAWTEKIGDPQADALRGMFDKSKQAISAGITRLRAAASSEAEFYLDGEAAGLDGFIGPYGDVFGARGGGLTVAQILDRLKQRLKPPPEDYLEPGAARETPGAVGLRAYVLGPPRNEELLFKDAPSSRPDKRETYLGARALEADQIERDFRTCATMTCGLDSMPFSQRYQRLADRRLLDAHAAPPPANAPAELHKLWAVRQAYAAPDAAWQRIDDDWHGVVGQLALKLDSDTNNSSLVLAFELEPGGEVMLFAADAQVGNWLSWHAQDYPSADRDGAPRISAADLLGRTTLYKVGHHGSHNATLRDKGLELMTSGRLTALIPVVEAVAAKRRWKMPFDILYDALVRQTQGRILRGDHGPDPATMAAQPAFAARVRSDPAPDAALGSTWIEYDVA